MKNYVQAGETVSLVAPYDVSSGGLALVGSIVGVAVNDVKTAASSEFAVEGVFTVGKTSALQIDIGDLVYLDPVNKVVNKTSAAQKLVGVAVSAAANPSATVKVRLNGAFTV